MILIDDGSSADVDCSIKYVHFLQISQTIDISEPFENAVDVSPTVVRTTLVVAVISKETKAIFYSTIT